jgi:hypothetical protein
MATRIWTGNAANVAQTSTVTFADPAWSATETVTTTINGKAHVVTMGSAVTTSALAATAYKKAFNGEAPDANEFTVNFDAQSFGEFAELTATVSSLVVTLTGPATGKPVTITSVTDTSAGSATLAAVVVATSQNSFTNADNWSADTVPVSTDDIVYDRGSVDCLYDIDTGIDPDSVTVKMGYTGMFGLPPINTDDPTKPYEEYRDQYLKFTDAGGANRVVDIGVGEGAGSRRLKIDVNDLAGLIATVHNTGTSSSTSIPTVLFRGGVATAKFNVEKGHVGIGFYSGDTAAIGTLNVSYVSDVLNDSTVWVGNDAAVTGTTVFEQTGGDITFNSSDTDAISSWTQHAGTAEIVGACKVGTLTVGGTVEDYNESLIANLNVRSTGTYDAGRSHEAKTITNCNGYGNGTIRDRSSRITFTNGIVLVDTSTAPDANGNFFTLDLGIGVTLTPS